MEWSQSVFVDIWPGWLGGCAISVVALTLLLTLNRQLGVSYCYGYAVDRVSDWVQARAPQPSPAALFPMPGPLMLPGAADPDLPSSFESESSWPTFLLGGILLGGLASGMLSRAFSGIPLELSFDYPGFDALWKLGPLAKAAILFGGGLLVGFGTRMAGGCTSGHAIMGAPGLQKASIVAMCVFMGTGIAFTWLLHALL
jgi:uncharacterized protein